jgi:hypothetical protein
VVLDFERQQALADLGFFLFRRSSFGHAAKDIVPMAGILSLYSPARKPSPCVVVTTTQPANSLLPSSPDHLVSL